jgi:hypothetical protein
MRKKVLEHFAIPVDPACSVIALNLYHSSGVQVYLIGFTHHYKAEGRDDHERYLLAPKPFD